MRSSVTLFIDAFFESAVVPSRLRAEEAEESRRRGPVIVSGSTVVPGARERLGIATLTSCREQNQGKTRRGEKQLHNCTARARPQRLLWLFHPKPKFALQAATGKLS